MSGQQPHGERSTVHVSFLPRPPGTDFRTRREASGSSRRALGGYAVLWLVCCSRCSSMIEGSPASIPSSAEDRHQGAPERLERLWRLPDVVDHQITILAKARVMDPALGLGSACLGEPPVRLLELLERHALGMKVDRDRHLCSSPTPPALRSSREPSRAAASSATCRYRPSARSGGRPRSADPYADRARQPAYRSAASPSRGRCWFQ